MRTQPPLAVVGLSALFPKAANLSEFWSNIRRGVDAITEVPETHWNPDDYFDENQKTADMTYARRGGFLSPLPFDPLEFGISPNNLEAIDTSQLLGLVGAKRALEHAGYGAGRVFDRSRVGCILGVTGTLEMVIPLGARLGHPRWRKALKDAGVADNVADDVVHRISQSYVPWQENSFPGLLGNVVAGRIANRLDLHGTNCVVDAACASSLSAIHLAALELWTGRSDMVVTGGIDTFNDIFMFMCFSKTPALSPSGDAKPFSDEADGTILGEGVGMLVLKRLHDAERDGDRIYAVLKGIGTSSDGAGNAVYAPKAEGQIRCLQDAYQVAGVSPDTIELVEAHGTGTKVGDATEVSGLMQVYKSTGRRGAWCAVGSVKSQIGHTKAAAGAAGVIKAILALQHRVLPPTIKVNQPPEALLADDSPFYVNTEARPWLKPRGYPRRAAVSAFGFGGSNFHCVLEESPQNFAETEWDGDVQVVGMSANSIGELASAVRSTLGPHTSADWQHLRALASASRDAFHVEQPHRLLLVLERDKTDIAKVVAGVLTMFERYPDKSTWSTPDGAYYGRGNRAGKLGILFPGQGSQYVNMLRELACRFPVMSDVLSEANNVFATADSQRHPSAWSDRLSDFIYPRPVFSAEARTQQETELRATQVAQPAIGAVSLAVLAVLEQFGVRPEAVAGHSYGELTALCASKRFAPHVLYRLSMLRGQLMAAAQEVDGGMLAVGAPLTQVEAALKELSVDLVVANHNSPTQVVLSGRVPEIERATSLFATRNIRGKKLSVAAAFHSPLVATASRAFRPMLEEVDFLPSTMPVYANSTGTEYPIEPQAARDLLATQLARPVHFVREVEKMYADGVRTFLEVGPGAVLTGLVNSILSGSDYRAMAVDGSSGKRTALFDLATSLVQLSAAGYPIQWDKWDPEGKGSSEETQGQRMRIPICGANYVKPRPSIPPRNRQMHAETNSQRATESVVAAAMNATQSLPINAPVKVEPQMAASSIPAPPAMPTDVIPPSTPSPIFVPKPNPVITAPVQPVAQASFPNPTAVEIIRQTITSLERMHLETSRLHRQFLESQEASLQVFAQLAEQKLGILNSQSLAVEPSRSASESWVPAVIPGQSPPQGFRASHERLELPQGLPTTLPTADATLPSPLNDAQTARLNVSQTARPATASLLPPPPSNVPVSPVPETQRVAKDLKTVPDGTATPVASQAACSPLSSIVMAVVSDKTGYPTEMLALEMSLDHDLGIDSIKRVEILSALQERIPNLPAFQPDELGALHTLSDVVALADARMVGLHSPQSVSPADDAGVAAHARQDLGRDISSRDPGPSNNDSDSSVAGPLGPTVLAVVSEKTGYPTEMLNLEMSLDHDLGIDSIKRVEILSALQERVPNLPAFQPEELGALHTLQDVVNLADARFASLPLSASADFAQSASTDMAKRQATTIRQINSSDEGPSQLGPIVLEVVSEKTGYPIEMLNLEMSLDHDLGIDSIKRVEILSVLQERVPNLPAFQPEELGALHTLQDVVSLADARSASKQPAAAPSPSATQTASPVVSVNEPVVPRLSDLGPIVLDVVSEKTGYPTEMLNLEMSLDHDLGIDSIKRVEILSTLQERVPGLPAFQPEELGALHTLKDVVHLADARSAAAKGSTVPAVAVSVVPGPTVHGPSIAPIGTPLPLPVANRIQQHKSIQRSIVRSVALQSADLRNPIHLPHSAEIWITDDGLELSLRIAEELASRGFKPRIVNLEDARISSVSADLSGLIIIAPETGITDRQLWNSIEWLQVVGPVLRRKARTTAAFIGTVSHVDGCFGFQTQVPIQDPVSGGLAGLVKCVSREWPDVTARSIDLGQDWPSQRVAASMVIGELLHEGPQEVGLISTGSYSLEIVEQSLTGCTESPPIQPGELIVVTGGARGVTAEAAFAVAKAWRPRLVILGRSPEPAKEPDWLATLATDAEIKRALIARAAAGTTPKAIATQCQQITAGREVANQLQRFRTLGISAIYHSVDVRDPFSVQPILSRIQQQFGEVRGIIHGAGVLADHRIEDKTKEQFDRVYQTKIHGLKNLMDCIDPSGLRVLGLFSSYTARFGRVGQLDYAVGNEVLNKQARQFAIQHPNCRVASFNWGPWDGGMVQGGLKQLFASEGIGLIPLEAGAELLVQELSQTTSRPIEVLVLAAGDGHASIPPASNLSPQPNLNGLDQPNAAVRDFQEPAAAKVAGDEQRDPAADFRIAFERQLDVARNQFLESHVLGGKAVLPVAMILEWLAHGAIHRNPGLELLGFDDFKVYQGVRLTKLDCISLRVLAGKTVRDESCYKVPMRLTGQSNGRETVHASGTVVLGPGYPAVLPSVIRVSTRPYPLDVSAAYANRLFHGPAFQGLIAIEGCSKDGIVVTSRPAAATPNWMSNPARGNWLADPLVIDVALQAVILWSQEQQGKPCLPCAVRRYRQFRRTFPRDGARITVRIQPDADQLIRCEVDFADLNGILVARMEGCESVAEASLANAFQRNRIE